LFDLYEVVIGLPPPGGRSHNLGVGELGNDGIKTESICARRGSCNSGRM
jgi:hypothetical protein